MVAQDGVKYGLKGGVNFSGFHSGGSSAFTDSFGFHAGLIANYSFSDKLSIQPELLYVQKTGGTNTNVAGTTVFLKSDRDYIDLPVMLKYNFASNFSLELGPQIGFLITENTGLTFSDGDSSVQDIKLDAESVDFSINLGISYTIVPKYLIQLRYSHGLSKVFDSLDDKNSVFLLSIGYLIN